ncbi:hypothetical protein TNCT_566781 [Trichonephila clavata]|uniref:Uncharacterized protein n=1 Tax=Trichonephila clavata TaxID=2740835 RepID=A0A8X6L8Z5_TRICU|nr:hypothetical protein TNCT_557511 [Trichonephila clavata]GFR20998.1 hypothetical protein TNCT_566781 [Trichonephila clavata]
MVTCFETRRRHVTAKEQERSKESLSQVFSQRSSHSNALHVPLSLVERKKKRSLRLSLSKPMDNLTNGQFHFANVCPRISFL